MLAQTVKDNLKDINNLRMRTKATKFGSLFQTVPVEKGGVSNLRQVLMREGLVEISEEEFVEDIIIKDEPVAEEETSDVADTEDELYDIVEDPTQLIVKFPVSSVVKFEEDLPFFKSLTLKLASL